MTAYPAHSPGWGVWCDHPGCSRTVEADTLLTATARATIDGWHTRTIVTHIDGADRIRVTHHCPQHTPEETR